MRKKVIPHVLFLVLILIVLCAEKRRHAVCQSDVMLIVMAMMEGAFIWFGKKQSHIDIMSFLWLLLIIWELYTSVFNIAHPVLIPCPENVFDTFWSQRSNMLKNVIYSMELLGTGFGSGMILAVGLGLLAGWMPRLREFVYPIANVMAPIPAIVFSPYLVSLMPSFRSASVLVVVLGVFWPNFLTTINRVTSIDGRILDSARMLELNSGEMILSVLFPCVLPGIISGLKVSVTTAFLMLNFAELMGATHGMGYFIQNSITYANYTHAVAGIICIGAVVTILNAVLTFVQKKLIVWQKM